MAGVSGRSRRRVSWGEQEEHRREEREGRRESRTALWAWREREGVTRVTSEWEGEERREEERRGEPLVIILVLARI